MAVVRRKSERSRRRFKIQFETRAGVTVIPSAVDYRLDCETTDTELLGWTSIAPSELITIVIPASALGMVDDANSVERKVLLIAANRGTDAEFGHEHRFEIERAQGRH